MNVTLVNKSQWSTESLQGIVDFLADSFGHVDRPVRLTIKSKRGYGTWGKAYFPMKRNTRCIKMGEYSAVVYIGTFDRNSLPEGNTGRYPYKRVYKKRAGGYVAQNLVEEVVHTIAHELRHVEQFEACRLSLGNLDAERPYWDTRALGLSFGRRFRIWEHSRASGYPYGSCEVDAELVAHGLLDAYRTFLELPRRQAA
jgi:hypothetical protein